MLVQQLQTSSSQSSSHANKNEGSLQILIAFLPWLGTVIDYKKKKKNTEGMPTANNNNNNNNKN